MYQLVQEYPLLSVVATGAGTLLVSWVWNNIVRPSARLTRADCKLNQDLCRQNIESRLCVDNKRIDKIEKYLSVSLSAQLKMCGALKIDCTDLIARMATLGLVEEDE